MNEIEALRWQLERYGAVLSQQVDRLYNALEELQRTTLLLLNQNDASEENIDASLNAQGFAVDDDGFFQSLPLLSAFRNGTSPDDAVSVSWGKHLKANPVIRHHMHCHRNIGSHLKHIRDRLGDVGWIYYQDAANASFQYPYIDQKTAIPFDFDWTTYHTFVSVNPDNNPDRQIRWTPPTVDYAGEGIIVSVSIPVWKDESFIGLWSIDLPIRYLYRDFSSSKPFPQQSQFIVNDQGLLLLHEKLKAEINQSEGHLFLHPLSDLGGQWSEFDLKAITNQETGVHWIKDAENTPWLFCHCHVPGVDWTLFSGLPKSAMEEAEAQRLRDAFQQVSEGNFSYRIEASTSSTLSTLVSAFNQMSTRLSQAEEHRQEIEKQLRQAQKMEAVGRLAGGVAHDFNNKITVIMGYAELAMMKMKPDDPLRIDLETILHASARSKELTRQLLGFARRQSIDPRVLDINEVVHSMLRMLRPLIGEDIELIWRPGDHIWPILVDPSQIDQILTNLCVNARDAIGGVGKIIIETSNIEIDDEYCSMHQGFIPGSFVRLTVSDDGEGMAKDTLNNIFEPFFSTKPQAKGTGLGLSTVYGIVKQNNGFIDTYSEPNHGSSFNIYLKRISDRTVDQPAPIPQGTATCGNETVMVVEDDPDILNLSMLMLTKLGYRVMGMNSPTEVIEQIRNLSEPIDLLITDVIMPDMNGRELALQVKEIFPNLKILFMSGYTSNVIVHRGVLDEDVFLLQKPFTRKELTAKVREVLESRPGS
jgi:signal transduction histidine kinase/CheY-like chemotaxis protein